MTCLRLNALVTATLVACGASTWAHAEDASSTINDNAGIFIDGKTFKVTPGRATVDAAAQVKKLGARKLGPGALIFRSGEELFIVDAPLRLPATGAAGGQVLVGADTTKPERPNRIRFEYVPPKKAELQPVYKILREHRALEVLQQMLSPFRLAEDVTIRTKECGFVNAWFRYEDTGPAVNICYEYLREFQENAPEEKGPGGVTRVDALIGQFLYLVAHEFGHGVFKFYNVPLFGSQEDAADRFAAYVLLWFKDERARRLVGGAAYSYRKILEIYRSKPKVSPPLAAYSSSHGLPQQRFFNLLCMAYGANPKQFAIVVDEKYLPESRAKRCAYEFETLTEAINQTIRPHIDLELARKVHNTRWLEILAQGARPTSQQQR